MTEMFHCRVDGEILDKARKVSKDLGTSFPEVVRMMAASMVRTRSVPFQLSIQDNRDILPDADLQSETLAKLYE